MNILGYGVLISLFLWSLLYERALFLIYLAVIGVYLYFSYLSSKKALKLVRRKIQIATWDDIGDPSIFGLLEIDTEEADKFIAEQNKKNPETPINYGHIGLKAMGEACKSSNNNGKICFGNFVPVDSVDLCLLLDMSGDKFDYVLIEGCNKLGIKEIAAQSKLKVSQLEKRSYFQKIENWNFLRFVPTFIIELILNILSFLSYNLSLNIPFLGLRKNHFGFGMVFDAQKYNTENVFFPLSNLTKTIHVTVLNKADDKVVARDNKPVIRKTMNINLTFDHRFADGSDALKMVAQYKKVWKNPRLFA